MTVDLSSIATTDRSWLCLAGVFSFAGYEALTQDDHGKFDQAFITKVRSTSILITRRVLPLPIRFAALPR